MWKLCLLFFFVAATAMEIINRPELNENRESRYGFEVDYANNQFLLDGQPFRYVSGSFHYFRTPRVNWRDRLRKMRAAGLNAVSTYVEWNLHEPQPGKFRWTGEQDIVEFINIAREEDLLVLLRPGPYICAERNLGGLPPWLMNKVPDIKMRTNDARYMAYVEKYLTELLTRVQPLLRGNGGPIIMVQVENEYGSFHACDMNYRENLRRIFEKFVGTKALLYTTDGSSMSALRCGYILRTYTTVDFGTNSNVTKNFDIMRKFQPSGPLVNSEFYPGWLTHWGEPLQKVSTKSVVKILDEMLSLGASVNIYMFYGGTNFGFTSGANGPENYSPQLTSYDYDAPLTEAGDPTEKYFEIRKVIAKYLPMKNMTLPVYKPKGNYGQVQMNVFGQLFDPDLKNAFGTPKGLFETPPSFEQLGISHLIVLYETILPVFGQDPLNLYADIRDRALVYIDWVLVGTLSRSQNIYTLPIEAPYGGNLQILVENQGHLNFGNVVEDFKGLMHATINNVTLRNWNVTTFSPEVQESVLRTIEKKENNATGILYGGPTIYIGSLSIEDNSPLDTYLDTTGWGKGVAFINNFNLGRYWPLAGPQMTLYVPASYLRNGTNMFALLEFEYAPKNLQMTLKDTADLGKTYNQRT